MHPSQKNGGNVFAQTKLPPAPPAQIKDRQLPPTDSLPDVNLKQFCQEQESKQPQRVGVQMPQMGGFAMPSFGGGGAQAPGFAAPRPMGAVQASMQNPPPIQGAGQAPQAFSFMPAQAPAGVAQPIFAAPAGLSRPSLQLGGGLQFGAPATAQ